MGFVKPQGYVLSLHADTGNPADSVTYFIGQSGTILPIANRDKARAYCPRAGVIKNITLHWYNQTTDASSEAVDWYIRVNDTTETLIYSGSMENSNSPQIITDLDIAIAQGDFIVLKMNTPAWVTNPVLIGVFANVEIQY